MPGIERDGSAPYPEAPDADVLIVAFIVRRLFMGGPGLHH